MSENPYAKSWCNDHDTTLDKCLYRHYPLDLRRDRPVQDTDHMDSEARRDFARLAGME